MLRKYLHVLVYLFAFIFSAPAHGAISRVVVNENEFLHVLSISMTKNSIAFNGINLYSIDLKGQSISLIFSSMGNYDFSEYSSYSYEYCLSPDGKYIAMLLQDSSGEQVTFKNTLVILNAKTGKYSKVSNRIIEYCWSPNSDGIAYITGFPQDDFPGFKSDGVWMYKIQDDNNVKIFSSGRRINWSHYDNNIYITDYYTVHKYIVHDGKIEKTELKGVYISPDGKYYASGPHETESSIIYHKDTNKQDDIVNHTLKETLEYYYYQSWLSGGNYLLVTGGQFDNIVIDVDSNKIINKFEGVIIGIDWQGKHALIQDVINTDKGKKIDRETIKMIKLY